MTLEETGFSPEDAQFYQGRVLSVIEIARGLRLAPHKLSDLTNAHFTNIEESNSVLVSIIVQLVIRVDVDDRGVERSGASSRFRSSSLITRTLKSSDAASMRRRI